MATNIKLTGEERRTKLLDWLKSSSPLTGTELAQRANVSRQVIVQDMTLLKARNEPILATSQGYVYMDQSTKENASLFERVIAVQHAPEQSEEELLLNRRLWRRRQGCYRGTPHIRANFGTNPRQYPQRGI